MKNTNENWATKQDNKTKAKGINYSVGCERELKIEGANQDMSLTQYISHVLELHAKSLNTKRNLTL